MLFLIGLSLTAALAQTATSRIVSAANNSPFNTRSEADGRVSLFAFDDEEQRASWSNLPTVMVHRGWH